MHTRIVHVVGTLRDGGAEGFVRSLLPRLAREPDLDVHVVSVYDARLSAAEERELGVPVHVIGRRGRSDIGFAPRLLAALRRIRPDIVHGHIHTGKYAGRIAALAAGVPDIVFTEHGDEAGGALRWAVKRLLNVRTSRFIVFTDVERARYAREEGIALAKIAVIPNGIPIPPAVDSAAIRAELGLGANDIALVTAARLVHQKNQELAIRSLAQLSARGVRNVKLLVVGDGEDRLTLGGLVDELALTESVRFLGYRTDAQRVTAACDVMVLPSRWEKMPLILGEAMLAGVPVVSTPWAGVGAFIEDARTGFLSTDWTVEHFADALERAITAPQTRDDVAERAANVARERFDLDRTVKAHAALYRALRAARTPRLGGRTNA